MAARPKILGQLLVDTEGVDPLDLQRVLDAERRPSERIGDALVRLGAASPASIARALSVQLSVALAEVPLQPSEAAIAAVQPDLIRTHKLIPIAIDSRTIRIAMSDPLNLRAIDDVQFQTGRRVEALVATPDDVAEGLRTLFSGGSTGNGRVKDDPGTSATPSLGELVLALPAELRGQTRVSAAAADLEAETRRAPVVRLVDRLLRQSIDAGASDIHIEETGEDVRVRARIDGRLR